MWSAIFPGQGSQHPGMGRFLHDEFPIVRRCFEEASDALHFNLKKLCFDGSEAELALTENTQPCLLLVSIATYRVLHTEMGFTPQFMAGHSVGEYAAVVAAGSLSFTQAMQAVRARGVAMQSAVPVGHGAMVAVMGLEPEQVFALCAWAQKETEEQPVQPANLNAPGQIVISGKKTLLDWIGANYKPELFGGTTRVKFIPLKVSAPFHCAMMKPAEEKMREVLSAMNFVDAQVPVVQNVHAEPIRQAASLRENLIQQICAPVRWIDCMHRLVKEGATRAVEAGPGRVLAGLAKKIDSANLRTFNMQSLDDIRAWEKDWQKDWQTSGQEDKA